MVCLSMTSLLRRAVRSLVCLTIASWAPAQRPPNIVLIVIDDLGAHDLGCDGSSYHETPRIDGLAREGVRCTQAYAASAVGSPSRAALLTGRHPARYGMTEMLRSGSLAARRAAALRRQPAGETQREGAATRTPRGAAWLPLAEVTVAEQLAAWGYATGHVGKWHLGIDDFGPRAQGFAWSVGSSPYDRPPSYTAPYQRNRIKGLEGLEDAPQGEYLTTREAAEAVGFIERQGAEPFFLYLAHHAVHLPLSAEPARVPAFRAKPTGYQRQPEYAAMLASVDAAVGAVLDALDRGGLTRDTLVWLTSDNGGVVHAPATSNHPLRAGKGYPYEGGVRVPLVVRYPARLPAGAVCEQVVSGLDFAPTVAALVGAADSGGEAIPAMDGVDAMPWLAGAPATGPRTLLWHFPHELRGGRIGPYAALRSGPWKLVRWFESGRRELYDLTADPGERFDRDDPAAPSARLDAALEAALAAVGARLPTPVVATPAVERPPPPASAGEFRAGWDEGVDRAWVGAAYWAQPLHDWRLRAGRVEVLDPAPNRGLHLLTHWLADGAQAPFECEVEIGRLHGGRGNAGFAVGVRGGRDYRSAAVRGAGMFFGVSSDGRLFLDTPVGAAPNPAVAALAQMQLRLRAEPDDGRFSVRLSVHAAAGAEAIASAEFLVPRVHVGGGLALINNYRLPGRRSGAFEARHWFGDWVVRGEAVREDPSRAYGPLWFTQHSVDRGVLRLSAQLAPAAGVGEAELWLDDGAGWQLAQSASVDPVAANAVFQVPDFDATTRHRYRVVAVGAASADALEGSVRPPKEAGLVHVAAVRGHAERTFPHGALVDNLREADPDVLLFAGGQIGPRPLPEAGEERMVAAYLGRLGVFGWAFGDLLRDRLSLMLLDPHGGPSPRVGRGGGAGAALDLVVRRTLAGHLPTPTAAAGGERYRAVAYGGVGFALLDFGDGTAPELVSDPQLEFLRGWSRDWRGVELKIACAPQLLAAMPSGANATAPWPRAQRDEILEILRRAGIPLVAGGDGPPVFLRHGVDASADASYGLRLPWIAVPPALSPEPGWPLLQAARDARGNPFTLLASGHPRPVRPEDDAADAVGHRRGAGHAELWCDVTRRRVAIDCWRLAYDRDEPADDAQPSGWPVSFAATDNDARSGAVRLPPITVSGARRPVVEVFDGDRLWSTGPLPADGRVTAPRATGRYRVVVTDADRGAREELTLEPGGPAASVVLHP